MKKNLCAILFIMMTTGLLGQTLWHVDAATGNDDQSGTSWLQSFQTLQRAIVAAAEGDTIWVARGTYRPSCTEAGDCSNAFNPDNTFFIDFDVAIYGGFPSGASNPGWENRNPAANPTLLNGSLTDTSGQANVYTIIHTRNVSPNFVLNGFTLTNGKAVYSGANPTEARQKGGAWFNRGQGADSLSSPSIEHCLFFNNGADQEGGALYSRYGNPKISNCVFEQNNFQTSGDQRKGGAIYLEAGVPVLTSCQFYSNSARTGGAIYGKDADYALKDCGFAGNSANTNGGAICNESLIANIDNCSFESNWSNLFGGAISNTASPCLINNSVFKTNTGSYGGGAIANEYSNPKLNNCLLTGNSTEIYGGAIYNVFSTPVFKQCTFYGNEVEAEPNGGEVMYNFNTPNFPQPKLLNCILWDRQAPEMFNVILSGSNSGTSTIATHSIVRGGWPGEGNLEEDPLFLDQFSGDFHLASCSPAINAGSPDTTGLGLPLTDLDGAPRIVNGQPDMGAYEFQGTPTGIGDSTLYAAACEQYLFNNNWYSESGTYEILLTRTDTCIAVTLHLTIGDLASTLSVDTCGSYSHNEITYTESGIYTQTLTSTDGCDSVITLYLTIGDSDSTLLATACDTYTLNGITYTESGLYSQTLTNAVGCDSTLNVDLTIPIIDFSIMQDGPILTVSAPEATFQWIDCATGEAIPGATEATFVAASDGSYAVVVSRGGCSRTSSCTDVVIVGTGEADQVVVFTPIGKGLYQLNLPFSADLDVYDGAGRLLKQKRYGVGDQILDTGWLPAGIYTLVFRHAQGVETVRIIQP